MKTPFVGSVDASGKLDPDVRGQIAEYIKTFAGLRIEVKVKQHKDKRSLAQNARYFALLTCGAASLGYDSVDDLHEDVAMKLLRIPDDSPLETPRRRRTPRLNTAEFGHYMDAVERLLIEYGADLTHWHDEAERLAAEAA